MFVGQRANMFSLRLDELIGLQGNNQCFSASCTNMMQKREPKQKRAACELMMPSPVKEAFANSLLIDATQGHQMCQ